MKIKRDCNSTSENDKEPHKEDEKLFSPARISPYIRDEILNSLLPAMIQGTGLCLFWRRKINAEL
jgi:hypothetical protein